MPSFSGEFQYLEPNGGPVQGGPCEVFLDAEKLRLVPRSGTPLGLDLGDIEAFLPGNSELTLTLYTGKMLHLLRFGKAFENLAQQLLNAYRNRLVRCLLLEDLEEVARFPGFARLNSPARTVAGRAEIRLYKTNLAVLPEAATGFQWRLADIDALRFDANAYAVTLDSADERLEVTNLAKRTEEFLSRLRDAIAQLNSNSAQALQAIFPFLNPDQLQKVTELMKEGQGAPLAKLKAIHPQIEPALLSNVVDAALKPYFDFLMGRVPTGWVYVGFKVTCKEQEPAAGFVEQAPVASEPAPGPASTELRSDAIAAEDSAGALQEEPILHWFFFPLAANARAALPANVVAWEATSRSGRATYFFRLVPGEQADRLRDAAKAPGLIDAAVGQLNRAIVLLDFRREPIYLPDDSLELRPEFRRYAIACRKIPELRRLRASFLGRAIHTSPQAWQKQVEEILEKAGL